MMNARFNIDYINSLKGDSYEINSNISISIQQFSDVTSKMSNLLSSFSNEAQEKREKVINIKEKLEDYLKEINRKIEHLAALINSEKSKKEPNKEAIQAYAAAIQRCREAYSEIQTLISKIVSIAYAIDGYRNDGFVSSSPLIMNNQKINKDNARIISTSNEFVKVMSLTYDYALEVFSLNPSKIRRDSSIDSISKIRNNHNHILPSSSSPIISSSSRTTTSEKEKTEEELLIKSRDIDSFLNDIECISKLRMPSGNLHKLGGKKFIDKMNEIGYSIVEVNGSMIDTSGMIHWEKKDD